MNEAVAKMLERYQRETVNDHLQALREILQEVALLGLWRAKFFEHGAFYGGTALRILHGLDRFSEDLDFSLLTPDPAFRIDRYASQLEEEIASFGFKVHAVSLKADTIRELLVIEAGREIVRQIPEGKVLKIKLEVDTDPPAGFATQTRYLLRPIPFAVRVYVLPDLFAGKMHAVLCRRWKNRVKGRDWYDLVWYAANHPELNLPHLETRMRQSGHWKREDSLSADAFRSTLGEAIDALDVEKARREVSPFVKDQAALALWSREFFHDVAGRIRCSASLP
ncbi:MAG: nucleotidyl transferase AbiEii/AbiGii toxin family protein [Deltaproteobacteria bacterium]|nr:MAG: nucleotidyl transferase AbiEii/AbiGii toxin family protein [Deltaproteobacteria bacterium]